MTSQDDCYFYYYSTCTKGDECQFRHEPAALRSERMCELWEQGICFRPVCKFRHMMIEFDRSKVACYWESQPSGCLKEHCPFSHSKPQTAVSGVTEMATNIPPVSQPLASQKLAQMPIPNSTPLQTTANHSPSTTVGQRQSLSSPQMSIPVLNAPRQGGPLSVPGRPPSVQFRGPPAHQRYQGPPMHNTSQFFNPMGDPMSVHGLARPPQYVGPVRPGFVHHPAAAAVPHPNRFPGVRPRGQMPYNTGIARPPASDYPYNLHPGKPQGISLGQYHVGDAVGKQREVEMFHEKKPVMEENTDNSSDFSDVLSDDEDWQDVDITSQSQKLQKSKQESRREIQTSRKHSYSRSGKSGDNRRKNERQKERYNSKDRGRERGKLRNENTGSKKREEAKSREEKEVKRKEKDQNKSSKRETNSESDKTLKEKECVPEERKESNSDIQIKSLEEILREKALKKLLERRQKQAEEAKEKNESEEKNKATDNDSKVAVVKSEVESKEISVENSDKMLLSPKKEDESEQKKLSPRKRTLGATVLKSVIGKNALEGSERESKLLDQIGSDGIKVKSFEEIMKEKKLRRNQLDKQTKELVENDEASESVTETPKVPKVVGKAGTVRMQRIVRKVTEEEVSKPDNAGSEKPTSKAKRIIRVMKPGGSNELDSNAASAPSNKLPSKTSDNKMEKTTNGSTESSVVKSSEVRVKSFDEIMEEKRKRAQVQVQSESGKVLSNSTDDNTASIQGRVTAKSATSGLQRGKFRKLRVVRRGSGSATSGESEDIQAKGQISVTSKKTSPQVSKDNIPLTSETEKSAFQCDLSRGNTNIAKNISVSSAKSVDKVQTEGKDESSTSFNLSNDLKMKMDSTKMATAMVNEDSEDDTFDINTPDGSPTNLASPGKKTEAESDEVKRKEEEGLSRDFTNQLEEDDEEKEDESPAKRLRISLDNLTSKEKSCNKMSEDEKLEQELEEALGNLSPSHSAVSLDEDDLLMEIEEMINL